MLSSCPVELPKRLGWLKSGRFLRLLSVLAALAILAGVLYNAVMVDRIPPTYQITVSNTTSSGLAVPLTSIDVSFSEEVRRETAENAFSLTESIPSPPAASAVPSIRATLVPTATLLATDTPSTSGSPSISTAPGAPKDSPETSPSASPTATPTSAPTATPSASASPSAPATLAPPRIVPIAGTFYWQGLKLIFTPSARLPLSSKFHVHIAAGVEDRAGNPQGGTGDLDFATVGGPEVLSMSPAGDSVSIAVDAPIEITFDRLMDTPKVIAGLTISPEITYQASWNGPLLTLEPSNPLDYGTTYTVTIGDPAADTDGTKLGQYVSSFKTVGVGLNVESLIPAGGLAGASVYSPIAVVFNEPIDPSSIGGAIKVSPSVSGTIRAISPVRNQTGTAPAVPTPTASGPTAIVFTPDNPLAPHTTYFVTLSPTVKRIDGQVTSGRTWTFITGDPPVNALNQIAFISPRSGVDNVWLMNPDGSNQREVTAEMAPVSAYDISGDGLTIAYSTGGVVKKMSLSGQNLTTLTAGGNVEYAPTITPDGTGLVVARRDSNGKDLGYWRYALVSGADTRQLTPDGAPDPNAQIIDGLAGNPGMPYWAPRAALTADGSTMLVVRGADDGVELVDTTGAKKPLLLGLKGNSRPVWVQSDGAFYLAGSDDNGLNWASWRISLSGAMAKVGDAASDVAAVGGGVALVVRSSDGSFHLVIDPAKGESPRPLTDDAAYSESSPSPSPNGSAVVFSRVGARSPEVTFGIWIVNVDGTGLTNLSLDGTSPRWIA